MSPCQIWECPNCGRLWVEDPIGAAGEHRAMTEQRMAELRGEVAHGPFVWLGSDGKADYASYQTCRSIPERVVHSVAEAAYILGGVEAAEACVNYQLRDAVREYERTHRG